jgi:CRISPR system Cascade subunit CasE
MIASVLKLSRSDFNNLQITDPYSIHRVVYSLFPKEDGGRDFLFVDKGGDFNERRILILSKRPPLHPKYGIIEQKNIPDSFLKEDHYGFEIRLNAVKRNKQNDKIIAVMGRESLSEWFCSKSESWGFIIEQDSLQIQSTGVQTFNSRENQITQNAVIFIGKMRVSDRSLFVKSFEDGIGRGKGFGFGLLQIVPLCD